MSVVKQVSKQQVYAVTGAASGMGKAAADLLRADGHHVIGVDLRDTEVIADLSTAEGRSRAARAVLALANGGARRCSLGRGSRPSARSGERPDHHVGQLSGCRRAARGVAVRTSRCRLREGRCRGQQFGDHHADGSRPCGARVVTR